MSAQASWTVQLFFDGACPLCSKDVAFMRWLDRKQRVDFVDIAAPDFVPAQFGTTMPLLMERLHARAPDGRWITGADAFRSIYAALGFSWLVVLSRLPGMRQLVDLGYALFAKNRLRLTGRCSDGACELPSAK